MVTLGIAFLKLFDFTKAENQKKNVVIHFVGQFLGSTKKIHGLSRPWLLDPWLPWLLTIGIQLHPMPAESVAKAKTCLIQVVLTQVLTSLHRRWMDPPKMS